MACYSILYEYIYILKEIVDCKCYLSEELMALAVLRWIQTRYLRITKPKRRTVQICD